MQFPPLGVQGWPLGGVGLFVTMWASFNHVPEHAAHSIAPQVVVGEEEHSWESIYLACCIFSRFLITRPVSNQ